MAHRHALLYLGTISTQTRYAFVSRENRFPLFSDHAYTRSMSLVPNNPYGLIIRMMIST